MHLAIKKYLNVSSRGSGLATFLAVVVVDASPKLGAVVFIGHTKLLNGSFLQEGLGILDMGSNVVNPG